MFCGAGKGKEKKKSEYMSDVEKMSSFTARLYAREYEENEVPLNGTKRLTRDYSAAAANLQVAPFKNFVMRVADSYTNTPFASSS